MPFFTESPSSMFLEFQSTVPCYFTVFIFIYSFNSLFMNFYVPAIRFHVRFDSFTRFINFLLPIPLYSFFRIKKNF